MNTEHKDIDKFIPFGEALRGFANQKFISAMNSKVFLKNGAYLFLIQIKTILFLSCRHYYYLLLSLIEFVKLFLARKIMKKRFHEIFHFRLMRFYINQT